MRKASTASTCFVLAVIAGGALGQSGSKVESGQAVPVQAVSPQRTIDDSQMTMQTNVLSDGGGIGAGVNVNSFVGAERFYNAGFTGSTANVAIIEGGNPWLGHDATQTTQNFAVSGAIQQEAQHPTWTTAVAAGFDPSGTNERERGIAFGADAWSISLLTSALANPLSGSGSFATNPITIFRSFDAAMRTGSLTGGETADVVNLSWGSSNENGPGLSLNDVLADAFVAETGVSITASAGNGGQGSFSTPGVGLNTINVGSTGQGDRLPVFDGISSFSSRGFSGFFDRDNTDPGTGNPLIFADAHIPVDIVAPGQDLTLPDFDSTPDAAEFEPNVGGTSFSAPTVAGGVALLTDAGNQELGSNPIATDARVVKAVLMNSADRGFAGFDNGQNIDGSGVLTTTQALDPAFGAGQMDLDAAFDQFLAGTTDLAGTDGGEVQSIGWDFGAVEDGQTQIYTVDTMLQGGTEFSATLAWQATFELGLTPGQESVADDRFADLDLSVFELDANGNVIETLAQSISAFQSEEHLSFVLDDDAFIGFGVTAFGDVWDFGADETLTEFAVAFAGTPVPAPFGVGVLGVAGLFAARRRRG